MSREILLPRARELIAPDIDLVRPTMLELLRATPAGIDGRRGLGGWAKSSYFHPIQDTVTASKDFLRIYSDEEKEIKATRSQACFVKDFDWYLAGLPNEEGDIQEVFQTIYDAGISFRWYEDLDRVEELNKVFNALNEAVLLPWAGYR